MFAGIGLTNPKHAVNVGSALRAAKCYGANFVVIAGRRYKRAQTDTSAAVETVPLFHCATAVGLRKFIPFSCVPVVIEVAPWGIPLQEYQHPENAFYIFGPEDGTLGKRITDWARDTVYIPTTGCMNLAATVNVVLYDRMAKLEK